MFTICSCACSNNNSSSQQPEQQQQQEPTEAAQNQLVLLCEMKVFSLVIWSLFCNVMYPFQSTITFSRPTKKFVSQYDWLQEKLYCQDTGYVATHNNNPIVRQNQSQRSDVVGTTNDSTSDDTIQVPLVKPNGTETNDSPPSFEEAVKVWFLFQLFRCLRFVRSVFMWRFWKKYTNMCNC